MYEIRVNLWLKCRIRNPVWKRCAWATSPLSIAYHDEEWGVPVHDDKRLFEFLILEGAQAGLSWETILRKRDNYRAAFDGFDPKKVAKYDERKVEALLQDAGIIRNRLKINAAVGNAKSFLAVQREFGSFDNYVWRFVNHKPLKRKPGQPLRRAHRALRRAQQRPAQPRLQIRRLDDLLFFYAGRGVGQRSRFNLLSVSRINAD